MTLPENLQKAIEKLTENTDLSEIGGARQELTHRYRSHENKKKEFITSQDQRLAYIAARLPATYAVIRKVLEEVRLRAPEGKIKTLLDLGAGPGSVMWAACDVFPGLEQIHLVEKDLDLAEIGKRLARHHEHPAALKARWEVEDLKTMQLPSSFDLVTLSYVVGELEPAAIKPLIEKCWKFASQFLIVIEPGTPVGFERIRAIRSQLISLGAHLAAPCPHAVACPMSGGDWCHFSERVERSFLHRHIKQGSLGYEDEKYSYVAVSKTPCVLPQARVLRHPQKRSGHVHLTLCTPEGLKQEIVSKRNPDAYRKARKAEWGDGL